MAPRRTAPERVAQVVGEALHRHRAALAGGPLLVAVSGGPDSMALLVSIVAASPETRPSLRVAHFSHGLRPAAERREAELVEAVAGRFGVPLVRGGADVRAHAKAAKRSLEETARRLRYAFFAEAAREWGAPAVALGHTLDDQAETVLLRLARGAGLRGLGAMREWSRWRDASSGASVALLRPLLGVRRAETEAVCAEAAITPARDASNRSLVFARNRVRHRVLPELTRLNPRVAEALARLAASVRADHDHLSALARSAAQGLESRQGDAIIWPRRGLADMPAPLLVRLFHDAWEALRGPGAALSQAHLEAMAALLTGPSGRELALPGDMRFSVEYGRCLLRPLAPPVQLPSEPVALAQPGSTTVGPWEVEVREMSGPSPDAVPSGGPWCAVLDADALGGPLAVRRRRPGDRFHPLGMEGEKRLQDFLVDAKVPRWERDQVPLVVSPRGIAWVAGHRVAAWARAGPFGGLSEGVRSPSDRAGSRPAREVLRSRLLTILFKPAPGPSTSSSELSLG